LENFEQKAVVDWVAFTFHIGMSLVQLPVG